MLGKCPRRSIPAQTIFLLMAATTLSWGIGVLSLVAPAGLGVQEWILYLFVRNLVGEANALLFVTLSRLVAFGVELLLTATWWTRAFALRRR